MKVFLYGFVYAFRGIVVALREQRNLKVHLAATLAVVSAGLYYPITRIEWCILLLCIALVMGAELINSALEDLVNLVTREHHPLAGKVKDMAAGAVLVAAVMAAIVGAIIFLPYL